MAQRDPCRILIIDDDAATLLALPVLIRAHFPDTIIQTAINADAALNWIRNFRYDVVLLDIWLPRIDGLTLWKKSRSHLGSARVLIMSGSFDDALKKQALEDGAYACLEKPILPDVLIEAMKGALYSNSIQTVVDKL
jgi:DNA-binding NarL/FixJ family response regulator